MRFSNRILNYLTILRAGRRAQQGVFAMANQRTTGTRPVGKCLHFYIRKGYYLGLSPDRYVCESCGEEREANRWEDFECRRRPPAGMLNEATNH